MQVNAVAASTDGRGSGGGGVGAGWVGRSDADKLLKEKENDTARSN